jgi:hypothetical protein
LKPKYQYSNQYIWSQNTNTRKKLI